MKSLYAPSSSMERRGPKCQSYPCLVMCRDSWTLKTQVKRQLFVREFIRQGASSRTHICSVKFVTLYFIVTKDGDIRYSPG